MLTLIGIGLLVYGYLSYTHPLEKKKGRRQAVSRSPMPEWVPVLHKIGGLLFMVIGGLLIVISILQ